MNELATAKRTHLEEWGTGSGTKVSSTGLYHTKGAWAEKRETNQREENVNGTDEICERD